LRILLTIHHPLDAGTGAPGVTVALRDAYRAAGHDADVLSFDDLPGRLPGQAKELLFPLLVAAHPATRRADVVDASSGDAWIWGRVRRALRGRGVLACRSHGLAHTFWEVEAREAAERGRTLPLRSRLYHGDLRLRMDAADLRGADLCLFLNAEDRERAVAELGVAPERAHVVRNGVPDALVGLAPPAAGDGPPRIACIGSYAPRKGVRQLAEALAPLLAERPELGVTFLGTRAPAAAVLADYPAAVRERLRVVESYDRAALPGLLHGHQLYVSASLAEGLSLALIEAMACGLAPVVTDLPGTRAVLTGRDDGIRVAARDAGALRRALAELLDDPERLSRIRLAAHATAQRFAWGRVAAEQLELYRAAVHLPASAPMPTATGRRSRLRAAARHALGTVETRTGFQLARAPSTTAPERSHPDLAEPGFSALCRRCGPFTMTSIERMYALYQAVGHVDRAGIPGDIVECGVWRGGSSMLAALRLLELGDTERSLWLFDTFEGMPEPGEHDADPSGASMAAEWELHRGRTGDAVFAHASLADVQANMATTSFPPDRLRYVRGKVEETIPATAPERIALLRLDTDWYESTRHELEHLYPRLAPGGVLIIDDYGHWQGARKAVDEWLAALAAPPLLTRLDDTGRMAVKPS
jgi:glycosyltransferase involved in cell wall biosynthesis